MVVEQHGEHASLGQREAAVVTERAHGTTAVRSIVATIQGHECIVFGQRAHGPIAFDDFGQDRRLRIANDDHAAPTTANVVGGKTQVVEEGGAGSDVGAGAADRTQHIRIDEVCGHLGERKCHLLGSDPLAHQMALQQSGVTVKVHLAHGGAGIACDFIRTYRVTDARPVDTDRAYGIRRSPDRELQSARMAPRRILILWLESRWQLAGTTDL